MSIWVLFFFCSLDRESFHAVEKNKTQVVKAWKFCFAIIGWIAYNGYNNFIFERFEMKQACLFALLIFTFNAGAQEILVCSVQGSSYLMEIDAEESFVEVVDRIEDLLSRESAAMGDHSLWSSDSFGPSFHMQVLAANNNNDFQNAKKSTSKPRNYHTSVTKEEKKNIAYLVTNLGNKSLVAILGMKSSLEKAGDRVNHVHPLRFLMCIFTDNELKAGFANVRNRSTLWKDFFGGLRDSLEEESLRGNVQPSFVQHFASKVGIDPNLIMGLIEERRWADFVDTLITQLPRDGNPTRYDM